MKIAILIGALLLTSTAHASQASANQGHHGGGNNGALGAAAGAFGGGSNGGQSGNGGSYWSPNPNSSPVDAYQPWPQSEMQKFQKP